MHSLPRTSGFLRNGPEGRRKLTDGASHRISSENGVRPGGGGAKRAISSAPSGARSIFRRIRWLAPPANFRWPSGPLFCVELRYHAATHFIDLQLTIPSASGRTSINEAETTAVMGRRCRPHLRAGAHARRGGARVRAHMRAPARTRATLSLPNTSWSANRIGHETLDLGCRTLEAPIRLRPYLPAA
jgi:hypothetical protein